MKLKTDRIYMDKVGLEHLLEAHKACFESADGILKTDRSGIEDCALLRAKFCTGLRLMALRT